MNSFQESGSRPYFKNSWRRRRFSGNGQSDQRFAQVGGPIRLAEARQDVGGREDDVVGHLPDRRAESHEPEFARLAGIARRDVAFELVVGDQFPQQATPALGPGMLVDAHPGPGHEANRLGHFLPQPEGTGDVEQAGPDRLVVGSEPQVEERPGGEVAPRQRAHRRAARHVLVLGPGRRLVIGLELGELADPLGEDRRDVLDGDEDGMQRVEVVPTRGSSGRPSPERIQGDLDRAGLSADLVGQLPALAQPLDEFVADLAHETMTGDGGVGHPEVGAIIPK